MNRLSLTEHTQPGRIRRNRFPGSLLVNTLTTVPTTATTSLGKLSPDDETLANHLRERGYETVATLSNPHLTEARNFDSGFDRYRNLRTKGEDKAADNGDESGLLASRMYDFRDRMRSFSTVLNPYTLPFLLYRYQQLLSDWPTVSGARMIDEFVSDLSSASSPFFGWTHLMDLHAPIHPKRAEQGGLHPGKSALRCFVWDAARTSRIHEPRYDTLYDSTLRYIDNQISRLIGHLESRGVWDETVMILTGDHGEVLWDRDGIYGHPRHHLYDELLRVPLLVRTPDGSGRRIKESFSLAWLHEIISEAAGIDRADFPAESGSLWLAGETNASDELIVSDTLDEAGHTVAVRDGQRKVLHHQAGPNPEHNTDHGYLQEPICVNYRADPMERHERRIDSRLCSEAEAILTEQTALSGVGEGFNEEMEQRLQDLGYKM